MEYNYEFLKIEPKQLWVQVRFFADGKPDIFKNIIVKNFTEENVLSAVKSHGLEAVRTWGFIDAAPETLVIPNGTGTVGPGKTVVDEPAPEFDEFTQNLVPTTTETDTQVIRGWEIVQKSQEEIDSYLQSWRASVVATMRQSRLALKQQGLLATVQSNIDALPEESQIEWEYAAIVERSSPLVASLGAALGLTETQLDDLFKLAITL